MATDKKQGFLAGLKAIREKVKHINFSEDMIAAQMMCILSSLSFVGFDMAFLYRQAQIHGFDVVSAMRGTTWEQLATIYLFFVGADISMQVLGQLFRNMQNNIQYRIQEEKNQTR